jgi:Tubulin-tyrosine ligase family
MLAPTEQFVNHLQHAQQLSNKANLARHLDRHYPAVATEHPAIAIQCDSFFPRCWNLQSSGPTSFLTAFALGAAVVALQRAVAVPTQCANSPVVDSALSMLERWVQWVSDVDLQSTKHVPAAVLSTESQDWQLLVSWAEQLAAGDSAAVAAVCASAAGQAAAAVALQRFAACDAQHYLLAGGMNSWILKPAGLSCGEASRVAVHELFYVFVTTASLQIKQAIAGTVLYYTLHAIQGVQVFQSLRGLIAASSALNHKVVIQKYIERPMLLAGRKFDIRQWVLVTSVQPLVVWGYSSNYLRLTRHSYSTDAGSLSDRFMHLCNHAVQREGISGAGEEDEDHCMWTTQQLREHMRNSSSSSSDSSGSSSNSGITSSSNSNSSSGYDEWVLPGIRRAVLGALLATQSTLRKRANGFEWLGFDLMLCEAQQTVLLLEANVSPDCSHSTPVTAALVPAATADALTLLLDEQQALPVADNGEVLPVAAARLCPQLYTPPADVIIGSDSVTAGSSSDKACWQLWYKGPAEQESVAVAGARRKATAQWEEDCRYAAEDPAAVFQAALQSLDQPVAAANADDSDDEEDEM